MPQLIEKCLRYVRDNFYAPRPVTGQVTGFKVKHSEPFKVTPINLSHSSLVPARMAADEHSRFLCIFNINEIPMFLCLVYKYMWFINSEYAMKEERDKRKDETDN